jgi:acyl phosphate:glycerol-3-phosphate acyltransferase
MDWVHLQLALLAAISYFVGAVPFGLIAGKLKGIDIRAHGSKNIGASNAGRVLGTKYFGIVFTLDLLKSFVPIAIASAIVARVPLAERTQLTHLLWLGVGVAAVVGHIFPIYLKFRGGKGVATGAGVVLGLWPYFTLAGVVALVAFAVVLLRSRYISLGSISAAMAFVLSYVCIGLWQGWDLTGRQLPLLVLAVLLASLVIWRHRENIRRLRAGTENKIRTRSSVDAAVYPPAP